VLAWLSVWREVQMICIWSIRCYCHPIISCFVKIHSGLTFLMPAYPGCLTIEECWQSVSIWQSYRPQYSSTFFLFILWCQWESFLGHPVSWCKVNNCASNISKSTKLRQWHIFAIHHHHHNHSTALFPGPTGRAGATRKFLPDFIVLGRITRGRHTDNPGGHHSIRANQQSTSINPPHPFYAGCNATLPIYPGLGQAQEYAVLHSTVLHKSIQI